MGWIALALLLLGAEFAVAVALIRRTTRLPLAFGCAIGFAVVVCAETVSMNALSLLDGVTRVGVTLAHAAVIAGGAAVLRAIRRHESSWTHAAYRSLGRAPVATVVLLPLVALASVSALGYAPNTGDSMTYHLARVAHWIQHSSVAVYPTGSLRQTVMMPGAEYVLLALQVVSGTDRLAALPQLGAYLVLVGAAPTCARIAGAPKRYAPWAGPIIAALPMGVLQASSTQNDLVAAVMLIAIVASSLRLQRAQKRWRTVAARLALVAVCCAAALTVKASALVISIPYLLLIAIRAFGRGRRASVVTWSAAAIPAAVLALLIIVPELARRDLVHRIELVVPAYPALSEWQDRAANVVRGALHHVPSPPGIPAALQPHLTTRRGSILGNIPQLVPHEDMVGNPLHAAAVLFALLALTLRFDRVPRRGRWAIAGALAAWVLFHATLRDNEYLSRLQLPLFALAPVFMAVLPPPRARSFIMRAVGAGAISAVAVAVLVAASNELRPPLAARSGGTPSDYYANNDLVREAQTTALRVAHATGCRRLGLFMGESGFEYPLAWQAMREGVEVRHVFGSADWPCIIYVEQSSFGFWNIPRDPVALRPGEWIPAAANHGGVFLYRRTTAGER